MLSIHFATKKLNNLFLNDTTQNIQGKYDIISYPSSLASSSSTNSLYFAICVQGDVLLFSSLSPCHTAKTSVCVILPFSYYKNLQLLQHKNEGRTILLQPTLSYRNEESFLPWRLLSEATALLSLLYCSLKYFSLWLSNFMKINCDK